MATMTFSDIFTAYYSLFRADSDVPISTDDEYTVGLRLANEAINYWSNYDGTYWKELYSTNLTDGSGAQTIVTSQTTYTAPTNFREAGGFVRILDTDGNEVQRYPIIEPQEAQFKVTDSDYCYFTSSVAGVYTLNINPSPSSSLNGLRIEYVYYKKPTELTVGTSTTEMSNPYFIVHRMLAMQFRASRNPYYQSALKDSENTVRTMQLDNNSGSWANPWNQADNSGTSWGE
jgi:hypothetical protein